MTIEEKKLLSDIQEGIRSIDEHLGKRRVFTEYQNNKTTRRAVEREFEIIGEAMNNLLKINKHIPLTHTRIIVDLRNRIIHSYDDVDEIIIWKIIIKDLPALLIEVEGLLNE